MHIYFEEAVIMKRRFYGLLMCLCMLMVCSVSEAITLTKAVKVATLPDSQLGILKAGEPVYFALAADTYSASSPSKIKWSLTLNSGTNPGLKLSSTKGEYVLLFCDTLKNPGTKDGSFKLTVKAQDTDGTAASITFTGTVMSVPVIKTVNLARASAGSGKKYSAKLEVKSGNEPLSWKLSGSLPEGITATKFDGIE